GAIAAHECPNRLVPAQRSRIELAHRSWRFTFSEPTGIPQQARAVTGASVVKRNMNIGAAQAEVTPTDLLAIELSGFAARTQPCQGVLDPIFAKCLHLEDGAERLLWTCVDAVALDNEFVSRFRAWAHAAHQLRENQVVVSA